MPKLNLSADAGIVEVASHGRLANQFGVPFVGEQCRDVVGVFNAHFDDPPFPIRIAVHRLRGILEGFVEFNHFTSHWSKHIANRFDGFNGPKHLIRRHRLIDGIDFDEYDVDIVFIEVDTVDESVAADEVFGTIEAVKTVSDMFAPVAGEVIEFNEALEDAPESVNSDPYGEGWIIKMRVENPDDVAALLSHEGYAELIG